MKLTKTQLRQMIQEAASEYVWGVKSPGRVANKYKISVLKKLIKEELSNVLKENLPSDDEIKNIFNRVGQPYLQAARSGKVSMSGASIISSALSDTFYELNIDPEFPSPEADRIYKALGMDKSVGRGWAANRRPPEGGWPRDERD